MSRTLPIASIASTEGGPCVAIADAALGHDGTWAGGTFWAPDDRSILVAAAAPDDLTLLDPAGDITGASPSWMADGAESWQRVAP